MTAAGDAMPAGGCSTEESLRVDAPVLRQYVAALYRAAGLARGSAGVVARVQVATDMRGIDTHGTRLAPTYVGKLLAAELAERPVFAVTADADASVVLDAGLAVGPLAGTVAARLAIRRARRYGVGLVAVTRAGHCGAAGSFALLAAEAGMIGVTVAETGRASLAAYGTAEPVLGNTALAIAVPRPRGRAPLLLDMACGALAWGKVHALARRGLPLPDGAALDRDGVPTTASDRAAVLLPFGAGKGSGLAMVCSVLAGLGAGLPAPGNRAGRGMLMAAISPDHLNTRIELTDRVEELAAAVAAASPGRGGEARLPGDRAWAARTDAMRHGIALDPHHLSVLITAGQRLGLTAAITRLTDRGADEPHP